MISINTYIQEAIINRDITENDLNTVITVNDIKRILESSDSKKLTVGNLIIQKLKNINLSYYSKIISDKQIEVLAGICSTLNKKLNKVINIYIYIADTNRIIGFKYTNNDPNNNPVPDTYHFALVRPNSVDASCAKYQMRKIDFNIASEKISDYIVKAVNKMS